MGLLEDDLILVRRQSRSKGGAWGVVVGESLGQRPHWVCVGMARQGRGDILGLAGMNDSSRLWMRGLVSSCLVPGPGMI